MLVVGCKPASSGDTSAWIVNENSQKVWEKTNTDANSVLRAAEGFGTLSANNGVVVKIEIGNPRVSKAGILFGYKKTSGSDKYEYYHLGVGTQGYNGTTPEYYLSYVENMTLTDITATTDSENPSGDAGNVTYLEGDADTNVSLDANFAEFANEKMTIWVGYQKLDDGTYEVRIGKYNEDSQEEVKWVEDAYKKFTLKTRLKNNATDVDGTVLAYAMLKKATTGRVDTVNKYWLINRTGKSAE